MAAPGETAAPTDPPTAPPPPGRPLLGWITLPDLVGAQLAGLAAGLAAFACGATWWAAVAVGLALMAALLIPLGKRPVSSWLATWWYYRRQRAYRIGDTLDFRAADGRSLGIYRDGSRVVAVVEVLATKGGLTRLGSGTVHASHLLPLPELATCLRQHDILLAGIDIVAHGFRSRSGTPAGASYEKLLGPLPATAHRTVWLAIAFDPLWCPQAARRRGGGLSGACRAVSIATQRVVRTLADADCTARILTAPEIRQAAVQVTGGLDPRELTQQWRGAEVGNGVNIGAAVDPRRLGTDVLDSLWVPPTRGTTVVVRLRPGRSAHTVRVGAAWRLTMRELPEKPLQPHMISMNGRHRDGLLAHLPLALPGADAAVPTDEFPVADLDALRLPSAGCGQLLGSDAEGRGVAIRLVGQGISRVYVAGELYLAQQLIFRALAIGERVLIRTDRPHSWEHLVTTIGNPERLTIATETHQPDADFTATVVDGVLAPAPHAGITTVYLTGDPLGWPDTRPELSIHQPGAVGNRITLRTGTTREELTLVSIPSETTYIGRPRGAHAQTR
ncbi:type VII secretion protein EccE [Nocardia otitidiscaviarum]|uniref:Type VII secretion protein EccE n=2 Tax=Nocardia otitidiscaviarum TaxID=1823 RepID=A0A516NY56_9NOCA|nr:type VII secretion protein EccE [Nocardia otitidiscaviarum]